MRYLYRYCEWFVNAVVHVYWGMDDYGNAVTTKGSQSFTTSKPYGY